jgi:hypothetical protein
VSHVLTTYCAGCGEDQHGGLCPYSFCTGCHPHSDLGAPPTIGACRLTFAAVRSAVEVVNALGASSNLAGQASPVTEALAWRLVEAVRGAGGLVDGMQPAAMRSVHRAVVDELQRVLRHEPASPAPTPPPDDSPIPFCAMCGEFHRGELLADCVAHGYSDPKVLERVRARGERIRAGFSDRFQVPAGSKLTDLAEVYCGHGSLFSWAPIRGAWAVDRVTHCKCAEPPPYNGQRPTFGGGP